MAKLFFAFLFAMAIVCTQAQNIGIGNTNPTEKLDVTGNVKADTVKPAALKLATNAASGKVLTSDANGNASWQLQSGTPSIGYGTWGDCATNAVISEYNPVGDEEGAADDYFGRSVSLSGNFAIVGAPFDNVGANSNQGSVSIYQHNGSEWVKMQKITDASGAANDEFGTSVSISGNYAIVGSPNDNISAALTGEGSASIYWYNGSSWVLMQKIFGAAGDGSGEAVSISGNYVIIGAPFHDIGSNTDRGSASIYQYNGNNWVFMQLINDATGATNDNFGQAVSISGNFAIVGVRGDDIGASTDQGSASIFQYNGSSWILMQKITDATGAASDEFGYSVSITADGIAAAGARRDDGPTNNDEGSVNTYQYNGSSWVLIQKLTDASSEFFGQSVAISGSYVLIGASSEVVGSNGSQGAAHIYRKVGNLWQKVQRVTDPVGQPSAFFGAAVSFDVSNKRFLVGAPDDTNANNNPGKAIFGKIN